MHWKFIIKSIYSHAHESAGICGMANGGQAQLILAPGCRLWSGLFHVCWSREQVEGQQILMVSHWCSRTKQMCTTTSKAYTYVTFTNISLAKASHMAKPKVVFWSIIKSSFIVLFKVSHFPGSPAPSSRASGLAISSACKGFPWLLPTHNALNLTLWLNVQLSDLSLDLQSFEKPFLTCALSTFPRHNLYFSHL